MTHPMVGRTPCPVCDHADSRVICTKRVPSGPFALIRRRECRSCGFKWYIAQAPEVLVEKVKWTQRGNRDVFQIAEVIPMESDVKI